MARAREEAAREWGVGWAIGGAAIVGVMAGLLIGACDGFAVILMHGSRDVPLSDIFYLSLYSAALYGATGLVLMVAIGAILIGLIRMGRYRVDRARLLGILVGIFVLFAVYVLLPEGENWLQVLGFTLICIFSGLALGGLSVYILKRGIRNDTLVAACISSVVWVFVLLYGVLWINLTLMSEERFLEATSLLSTLGLLLVVSLVAIGLYRLCRFMLQKYDPRRTRQAGWTLLGVMASVFIAISVVGPLGSEDSAWAERLGTSPTGEKKTPVVTVDLKVRPNVLWIVMDTVQADHVSCYGYHRQTTPNIDMIASEGILYENMISTASWTLPSHASMFTGMFSSQHGADAEHQWLDDDFDTIAEVLSSHGYRTLAYTNNRVLRPGTNMLQGFDAYIVTHSGQYVFAHSGRADGEGARELSEFLRLRRYIRRLLKKDTDVGVMDDGARETNEVVKGWIANAHQAEEPFFLFINYMEAHLPYRSPPEYAVPYLPEGVGMAEARNVNQEAKAYVAEKVQMDDEDFAILRARYDGSISYLDIRMGELFDYLRQLDILDDTVLIITSDHGENFGEHHLMGHALCLYDTLLRVPLIIRYPQLFDAGTRVDEVVQPTDLFPTILDILGIGWNEKEQVQGHSLLTEGQRRHSTSFLAEEAVRKWCLGRMARANPQFDVSKYDRRLKTVQDGDFKYIWASDGRDELYNIRADPEELNNLIEVEPEKAAELKALLKEWLNSFETYRPGEAEQIQ